MQPIKKSEYTYQTLEEIRLRKEELEDELQKDGNQFSTLWNDLFTNKEDSSRSEYIAGLVSKGFIAFDLFLTVRKLMHTYGFLTGRSRKRKKR